MIAQEGSLLISITYKTVHKEQEIGWENRDSDHISNVEFHPESLLLLMISQSAESHQGMVYIHMHLPIWGSV